MLYLDDRKELAARVFIRLISAGVHWDAEMLRDRAVDAADALRAEFERRGA